MAKFLDLAGLETVWDQIKDKFITKEDAQALVAETKNSILDGVSENYDTLKEIADWINANDGGASITEMIEGRKAIILPIDAYGFDTNIRINQAIDGASLVNEVLRYAIENKRQVIIRCGDYDVGVAAYLQADDYKGFTVLSTILDPAADNPTPALEKCVFLYSESVNKTFTFYEKSYTNQEIDSKILSILNATMIPITTGEIDEICAN